ncbi:MAG: hypothetical protein WC840_00120 [Candidatus Peribacteraceae bacterium]
MANSKTSNILGWLNLADTDYLVSRKLLLDDFLVQGVIFANTALEKYSKMILEIREIDVTWGHQISKHYEKLKANGINLNLNKDFLLFLEKGYKLRYFDHLEIGFNININQVKTLIQLDESVAEIRSGIQVQGSKKEFKFDLWVKNENPALMKMNHVFGKANRDKLVAAPCAAYALRIIEDKVPLELDYWAKYVIDDGKFNEEVLKPELKRISSVRK